MTKIAGRLAALILPAFVLAGAVADSALAQEKKMESSAQPAAAGTVTIKEIAQNEKLRVYEATYKPGEVSPTAERPMRVVHALKGGTLQRTYADGTKESVQWKTGDTKLISETRAYAVKNIGKGDVRLLVIAVK